MPLVRHLAELRTRLMKSAGAVLLGAIAGFFLWDPILAITTQPYCAAQNARGLSDVSGFSSCQLFITEPLELLTTRLTVAGYLGFFFASPVILWQLWRFITPGLQPHEKRYAVPFVTISVLLFTLGAAVSWFTFPRALTFFLEVGGDQVSTLFSPAPYLKLIFLMMLIFGIAFEFPLLLVFLQLANVVSSKRLRSWRRQAITAIFVVGAIVTPSGDPYSLIALALPLCLFYELAIVIGRILKK